MKIFKELKKLGYKHYAECTIEELDDLPLNSEERIMEQALVLRWFREKHSLSGIPTHQSYEIYNTLTEECFIEVYPLDCYEEAELTCLQKLIQIVKDEKLAHTTN